MIVVDNFLDAATEREKALSSGYAPVCYEGFSYPGMSETLDSASIKNLQALVLSEVITEASVFYRYYSDEMEQAGYIHSDANVAKWTGIVFLSEPRDQFEGLACWKHKGTGLLGFPTAEQEQQLGTTWQQLHQDGFDESLWHMTKFVPMRPGRLALFPAFWWHSRYPEHRPAERIHDARLIKVFFCR